MLSSVSMAASACLGAVAFPLHGEDDYSLEPLAAKLLPGSFSAKQVCLLSPSGLCVFLRGLPVQHSPVQSQGPDIQMFVGCLSCCICISSQCSCCSSPGALLHGTLPRHEQSPV